MCVHWCCGQFSLLFRHFKRTKLCRTEQCYYCVPVSRMSQFQISPLHFESKRQLYCIIRKTWFMIEQNYLEEERDGDCKIHSCQTQKRNKFSRQQLQMGYSFKVSFWKSMPTSLSFSLVCFLTLILSFRNVFLFSLLVKPVESCARDCAI